MVKMRQRHLCVFEFEQGTFDEILAYIQYNADFMRDRLLAFHIDITPEIHDFLCSLGAMPFKINNQKILQQGKVKQLLAEQPITQHDISNNVATQKIKITLDSSDLTHVVMETIGESNSKKEHVESTQHNQETTNKDSKSIQPKDHVGTHMDNAMLLDTSILHTKSMPMATFKRAIRSGEEIILESHATFLKDIHEGALIKSYGNLHIYGKCNGILECFGDYIIMSEFGMGRISLQNVNLEGKMLEEVKKSKKLKMLTIEDGIISLCELS